MILLYPLITINNWCGVRHIIAVHVHCRPIDFESVFHDVAFKSSLTNLLFSPGSSYKHNRLISQIQQCIRQIFHNAPFCTNGASWDKGLVHCGLPQINKPYIAPTRATSHEHHGVSNHRKLDCPFNCLFMVTADKVTRIRITYPILRQHAVYLWIHLTKASDTERVPMLWCHLVPNNVPM